jgi:tRNA uracil 4-sulfurtransferase
MESDVIILRYGELSLKSTYVRKYFETMLVRNIKNAFSKEKIPVAVHSMRGRIFLTTPDISNSLTILPRIFGIVSFSPAVQTTSNIQDISSTALQLTKNVLDMQKSFAIRVTRVGTHPFSSQDVAVHIGNDIVQNTHAQVDLSTPDFELFIEIREQNAFVFTEKIKGVGGLPQGTQGTVLALIKKPSSLLAAWYLMRRGCYIIFVITNPSDDTIVQSFLKHWYATAETRFIDEKNPEFYQLVSTLISEKKCDAMVSDHTLQTPTQTLSEIASLKKNIMVPLLNPLLTLSQTEIEDQCKNRGILL